MQVTPGRTTIAGWLLVAVGLGLCAGDIGARILGWDGPTTVQFVGFLVTVIGVTFVEVDKRRRGRQEDPASQSDPSH